jgi:hypothetical protein
VPWPSDIEHELACPLGHEVTERLSLDCCPWLVVDVIHGQLNVSFVIVGVSLRSSIEGHLKRLPPVGASEMPSWSPAVKQSWRKRETASQRSRTENTTVVEERRSQHHVGHASA